MNKFKALLLDIDGVLLNKEDDTPMSTWRLISKLINNDISVSFVTARPYGLTTHLINKIDNKGIHILDNGAFIIDNEKQRVYTNQTLRQNLVNKIFAKIINIDNIRFGISGQKYFYANHNYFTHLKYMPSKNIMSLKNLKLDSLSVNSIWIRDINEADAKKLQNMFDKKVYFHTIFQKKENLYSLFIHPSKTSKSSSTDKLSKIIDIPTKEMVFIGDSIVDLKSMQKVGFSVATANAPIEIAEHCNIVTKNKYSLGLEEALYQVWPWLKET